MDRTAILGFILIGLVLMIWMYIVSPPPQRPLQKLEAEKTTIEIEDDRQNTATLTALDTLGSSFAQRAEGIEKFIFVETENFVAKLTSKGGSILSWKLKKYKTWDQHPVNLINQDTVGEFNLFFVSNEGKHINTGNLFFDTEYTNNKKFVLMSNDSLEIDFILPVGRDGKIIKKLIFKNKKYSYDVIYKFERVSHVIPNAEYDVIWDSGLRYPEYNSVDESFFAESYFYSGGELTSLDASNFAVVETTGFKSGKVDWVAVRSKYFAMAIIPREGESIGASLSGWRYHLKDDGVKESYSAALRMRLAGSIIETSRFTVFLGPLEFDLVKSFNVGLDKIMSLGITWLIRPISEYFIIPLFKLLNYVIPNYGVVLIVFSIIMKLLLHPLTKQSMKSMQKMQALQPMMNEIREKYKSDPQKMNQQIMRLYKEYGVNPAGGCLPLLLQLPILYALWEVFRSIIELRQASFIWWIKDLSVPDVLLKLPFRFPLVNIDQISGLALLLGITMFIQQKMTIKDPRQKAMIYILPIMLTLLFTSFPSGLNLYYFMFNILSIAQQSYFNKKHKGEPLRKVELKKKSGGILSAITKDLPKAKR